MPKQRRRRRFFALEGRFEVGDTGELEGVVDPAHPEETSMQSTTEDEAVVPAEQAHGLPGVSANPDSAESSEEDLLPPAFRLNRDARKRVSPRRPFTFWSMLFLFVGLIVGALAGRFGLTSAQKPAADLPANTQDAGHSISAADAVDLDAAYSARHERSYEKAEQLFTALRRRHPDWGVMDVEMGRTLFYAGKLYDANAALKSAERKGWKPAEADFLLGVLDKARKAYPDAEANFAKAVSIDPTQPEYYFFWGECLRDEGKLLDATAKFRSALLRNQYETATSLYRAKLWLTAIETDQESLEGIKEQIDALLAGPRPPLEASIAAAARSIKAGDFAVAAGHLARARRRSDPTVFRYIISDPFFAASASRPEMAGFFSSKDLPTDTVLTPRAPLPAPALDSSANENKP